MHNNHTIIEIASISSTKHITHHVTTNIIIELASTPSTKHITYQITTIIEL